MASSDTLSVAAWNAATKTFSNAIEEAGFDDKGKAFVLGNFAQRFIPVENNAETEFAILNGRLEHPPETLSELQVRMREASVAETKEIKDNYGCVDGSFDKHFGGDMNAAAAKVTAAYEAAMKAARTEMLKPPQRRL